jgi:adenosine deaminase
MSNTAKTIIAINVAGIIRNLVRMDCEDKMVHEFIASCTVDYVSAISNALKVSPLEADLDIEPALGTCFEVQSHDVSMEMVLAISNGDNMRLVRALRNVLGFCQELGA